MMQGIASMPPLSVESLGPTFKNRFSKLVSTPQSHCSSEFFFFAAKSLREFERSPE